MCGFCDVRVFVCMCVFCNVRVCEYVRLVLCGFGNMCVCVRVCVF
jgi:hypothetical protein